MKVLIISNQGLNSKGTGNPILYRMKDAISLDKRVERVEFYPVRNKISSFFKSIELARKYNVVHVHFGGLYALILRLLLIGSGAQLYITFHGTDIHAKAIKTTKSIKEKIKIKVNQYASFLSLYLFDRCGFVAEDMIRYIPSIIKKTTQSRFFIQGLGVDYQLFKPFDSKISKKTLNLDPELKYVLFSDVSNTNIKRRDIAEKIVNNLDDYNILIMSGVKPSDVPKYINACDFAILTSDEEGSPNIIREVLALNKPFFSVNVGDANKQLRGLVNSAIIDRDALKASKTIQEKLKLPYVDNTRENLRERLDFSVLCKNMVDIYEISLYNDSKK